MARFSRTLPLLLVALGTPLAIAAAQARGTASAGTSRVRAALEATNTRYVNMLNKGDVAGFARVYDADAAVLAPNMETMNGQPAIAKWWQGGWDAGVRDARLATVEVFPHGNEATEIGRYEIDVPMPGGGVTRDHGKYMVLWKRNAKGEWKWHRDIWNSDVAPPAPAPSGMKNDSTR